MLDGDSGNLLSCAFEETWMWFDPTAFRLQYALLVQWIEC